MRINLKLNMILMFLITIAYSNPEIEWSYTFGGLDHDSGIKVQTDDGGYVLLSTVHLPATNDDIALIKADNSGQVDWIKYFGTDYNES